MGIDPGLGGGIAILGRDGILLEPIPTSDDGKRIDLLELAKIMGDHAPDIRVCYLEDVHAMPKQGVVSMFTFGKVVGILQGMLGAFGIPFVLVRPQQWMGEMYRNIEGENKERSITAFERLYPGVNALRTTRSKKPDLGLVEAALIAEYGRRQTNLYNLDFVRP